MIGVTLDGGVLEAAWVMAQENKNIIITGSVKNLKKKLQIQEQNTLKFVLLSNIQDTSPFLSTKKQRI